MWLLVLIALPFIGAALAGALPLKARNRASGLAALVGLAGTLIVLRLYPRVLDGGVVRAEIDWLPQLGVNLSLRLDGFAWMFALLIMGIGALVALYARYYMAPTDPVPRFFAFLLAFMGSMLGVVLSGNLLLMVFFWELTSLMSFLLIGYWHHRADARRGARMALTVTASGGLALFAGVILIGHIVGSYDLDQVLASADAIRAHRWYLPTLVLVALGALTKSAQFPFQFWLPGAMAAPTPVSAYLHSATMVKAGVFLLARLWPVLSGTEAWFWIIGGAGLCTLLIGSFAAIFQQDLKGVLANSTISHLGLITLLLGLNSPLAAVAAVFHVMNHATFKASLFMAAGIVDHETGTRDLRRLSGLRHAMPITATLASVAAAAMAGVPLLNGFLSKEMFFAETTFITGSQVVEIGLPAVATLAGAFSVAYSLRFVRDVFFGPLATDLPNPPHEPPRWMRFPIELLVLVCLVVGIAPGYTVAPVLAAAAQPVVGGLLPEYSLAIWHGINLPLMMSVVAMAGGGLIYLMLHRRLNDGRLDRVPLLHSLRGTRLFDRVVIAITRFAKMNLHLFATRRLQPQLLLLVCATVLAGAVPLARYGVSPGTLESPPFNPVFLMLWLIGMACAIGAAWQAKYHRLVALILMGGAGLITCLTYVWFSAPDLALTQLLVEVVTLVLMLLGLRWLPKRVEQVDLDWHPSLRERIGAYGRRGRDLAVAIISGLGIGALTYMVLTRPFPQSLSPFYLERALPEGGGSNVVNVIIVDFRGFDTMGEIVVLGAVALTVFALLRRFRPAPESIGLPQQQNDPPLSVREEGNLGDPATGYLQVPAQILRLMLPILWLLAAYLFLRGHNEPGGGFVAGLLVAIGILLQYMASGTAWTEAHLTMRPQRWIGTGMLLVLVAGCGAWLFGFPFLTSHAAHPVLPVIGEVPLPSASVFDLGVLALVVGATVLILTSIAHQAVRGHRVPAPSSANVPRGVDPRHLRATWNRGRIRRGASPTSDDPSRGPPSSASESP